MRITACPGRPAVVGESLRSASSSRRSVGVLAGHTCHVTGFLEIPAGASSGEATLSVPAVQRAWQSGALQVYEDGGLLKDLSAPIAVCGGSQLWEPSEALPAILIIDADAPTRDMRAQMLRRAQRGGCRRVPADRSGCRTCGNCPCRPSPMPNSAARRVRYHADRAAPAGSADDVATLDRCSVPAAHRAVVSGGTAAALDRLTRASTWSSFRRPICRRSSPSTDPAWQALRDWLATGPTLCVYDMALSQEEAQPARITSGLEARVRLSEPEAVDGPERSGRVACSQPAQRIW